MGREPEEKTSGISIVVYSMVGGSLSDTIVNQLETAVWSIVKDEKGLAINVTKG